MVGWVPHWVRMQGVTWSLDVNPNVILEPPERPSLSRELTTWRPGLGCPTTRRKASMFATQLEACIAAIKKLPHCNAKPANVQGRIVVRVSGPGLAPTECRSIVPLLASMFAALRGQMAVYFSAIYHAGDDYEAWTEMVARVAPFATMLSLTSSGVDAPLPAVKLPPEAQDSRSRVHLLRLETGPLSTSPVVALVNRLGLGFLELIDRRPHTTDPLPPAGQVHRAVVIVLPKTPSPQRRSQLHEWVKSIVLLRERLDMVTAPRHGASVFYAGFGASGTASGAAPSALVVLQESCVRPLPRNDVRAVAPALPSEFPSALLVVNCRTGYIRVGPYRTPRWGLEGYSAHVNAAQLRTVTWQRLQRGMRATRQLAAASPPTPTLRRWTSSLRCAPVWFQGASNRRPVEAVMLHLMACLKRQRVEVGELVLTRVACVLVVQELIEVYGGAKFAAQRAVARLP